ncbi:MAG TPA: hypothetical protein PL029_08080 [Bacteroidia bacterium]|nr:hypothetical protein [Bacteroidia bacterium]
MKLSKTLLVFSCCLALIACKRKGTVSGTVTNVFDNKPVEGVEVRITQSAELDPSNKAMQVSSTDPNGNFKINATYNTRVTYDYYISLSPNANYNTADPFVVKDTTPAEYKTYFYYTSHYKSLQQDIKDVKKSKGNQNFAFNVAPAGRLRIIALNVAPADPTDKIEVSVVDKNLPDGSKTVYSGKNTVPATGSYMLVPTSGTVSLKWKVTRPGGETLSYDTIPLPAFSKATYYINY